VLDLRIFKEGDYLSEERTTDIDYKGLKKEYSKGSIGEETLERSPMLFENLKWMTTNEAAAYLRKSTNAIRTAVCRGHITARKFRRRLYFKRSELDRLLETSTTVGG
jgi:excisionase family DNA binding protein